MFLDLDSRYTDVEPVGSAINRRDGVLLAVIAHSALLAAVVLLPPLPVFQREPQPEPIALEAPPERPQFVFVQPRVDLEAARPRPRADDSDKTRIARAPERLEAPANRLPASRGNSSERTEVSPRAEILPSTPPSPAARESESAEAAPPAETMPLPPAPAAPPAPAPPASASEPPTRLGDALRNLQRYVEGQQFENSRGNVQDLGPLQFDTKGVEFGPWVRRFIAQVRRNWFVPYAAMTMRGRVVLQFNVHKDGRITDLAVVKPSEVTSFNSSAFNALSGSNPTEPLPAAYPDDKAFFTVTFYYNESPDTGQNRQ